MSWLARHGGHLALLDRHWREVIAHARRPLPCPVLPLLFAMLRASLGRGAVFYLGGGDARCPRLVSARLRAVLLVEPTRPADQEPPRTSPAGAVVRIHPKSARTNSRQSPRMAPRCSLRDNASTRGAIRLHPGRLSRPLRSVASPGLTASASSWPGTLASSRLGRRRRRSSWGLTSPRPPVAPLQSFAKSARTSAELWATGLGALHHRSPGYRGRVGHDPATSARQQPMVGGSRSRQQVDQA